MSLLDVGCGPGSVTLDLAEVLGPDGTVVGVDAAANVVGRARAAGVERGDRRTRFETADAYGLPFADDSFDVVHAHQVLQHLDRPVAALREMARVCRPGGIVAVRDVDYGATTWEPHSEALTRWLDLYTALARANGGEPHAGRHLVGWAEEAGLADITDSASAWTYARPEERTWLAQSWATRVRESLRPQAVARGHAEAELEEIAEGWLAWAAEPQGWFSFLHTEVLAVVRT
jgi:ubiquinone/menaquinone biosynthesis C-methylase UbiE